MPLRGENGNRKVKEEKGWGHEKIQVLLLVGLKGVRARKIKGPGEQDWGKNNKGRGVRLGRLSTANEQTSWAEKKGPINRSGNELFHRRTTR